MITTMKQSLVVVVAVVLVDSSSRSSSRSDRPEGAREADGGRYQTNVAYPSRVGDQAQHTYSLLRPERS